MKKQDFTSERLGAATEAGFSRRDVIVTTLATGFATAV